VRAYVERGYPIGGFLTALLANDLVQTVKRADAVNLALIPAWVDFMLGQLPAACWGSPERVRNWQATGGLEAVEAKKRVMNQPVPKESVGECGDD
jgi:hypothetical protein